MTWLDDHSRYVLQITAHRRVSGPIVVAQFRAAVAAYGAPASTLTDNGMVFTTRLSGGRGGRYGFEAELRRLGIEQKSGRPSHPQTQGKVERFQQTLKNRLRAQPGQPATISQLQALLDAFTIIYRVRADRIDADGKLTRRVHGKLHHIGIGRTHARTPVLMLIRDLHIRVSNAATGELLRELNLDPARDYQPTGRPPGPKPRRPQTQ